MIINTMDLKRAQFPPEVTIVINRLEQAGFAAYAVGGCVRDLLRGEQPYDWDVATDAKPEDIQRVFPESFYTNAFGTVVVQIGKEFPDAPDNLKEIEVTTYRVESAYTDSRHPEEVHFVRDIAEDLARRDFTINAMALRWTQGKPELLDPFGGAADLERRIIKAVGKPDERFTEDALRLMRAVRLATQLDFTLDERTLGSIKKNAGLLRNISAERVRDELMKIIALDRAEDGVRLLESAGLLHYIIPELEEGINVTQNKHHIYTVWEHNVRSLGYAVQYHNNADVRLASLLHDIAKPRTKRGEGEYATFYGHEVVGARMAKEILRRLKFPHHTLDKVVLLIRYHLFYYNVGEVTESSVRRLVNKVGEENIADLVALRVAERKGSGTPKAKPYKLRHLEFMVEKVLRDPISVKTMAVNGSDLMQCLGLASGPKIGLLLNALFEEVLDDSAKNNKDYLICRAGELQDLSEDTLQALAQKGKEKMQKREEAELGTIKKKHFVE